MQDKRLFLIDAYAMIYRAYYAMIRSPRITSKGLNTSAVFGFVNSLDEVIRKEKPTHLAVCFDPPHGHTFRHERYDLYKATREKQPEDITIAIPYIERLLDAYRIPRITVDGYEADDVIGTISRIAEAEGYLTYMMTPDKDYGQLVTDRVLQYRPPLGGKGMEIRTPEIVCEHYGIDRPSQMTDLLALEGDTSDNIPGCPGIGPKSASALIKRFGGVEELLANVDQLKGAQRVKVADNADQIRLSYELAKICTTVPMPDGFSIASLERREPDAKALADLFTELEFRMFIKRMGLDRPADKPEPAQAAPAAPAADGMGSLFDLPEDTAVAPAQPQADATTVEGAEAVVDLCDRLRQAGRYGFAAALDNVEPMRARILGLAFALPSGESFYMPMPDFPTEQDEILALLSPVLAADGPMIVSHDFKASYVALKAAGVRADAPLTDTAVMHYLVDPEMKHTLDMIVPAILGEGYPDPKEETGRPAALRAAAIALRLEQPLRKAIASEGLEALLTDIEIPMVRVLGDMEYEGVRIDTAELRQLSIDYTRRLNDMEQEVYRMAGKEFNVASPSQVGEVLFGHLAIDPKAKKTKSGSYSTTEEILRHYAPQFPIVSLILRIRALKKLLSTYINSLPTLINGRTGKIHTTYNQTVTATGRLSSTNPNLQNIPIRSDDGREIRRAFIPDPGNLMLSADYSQIELRLMADLSGDPDMVGAFAAGDDIHRATAAKIYHLDPADVTDNERRKAKTANFGIIYGISAFGLAERLGIPRGEAKELIDGYFRSYPHIREYIDSAIAEARDKGSVRTVMGRLRRLPDINSRNATVRSYAERNAVNAPIQGSAADIIKVAMVAIAREINDRGLRSRMILQVHDELIFNVVPDELPVVQELVARLMTAAYSGKVRLEVSAGVGANWLEAH